MKARIYQDLIEGSISTILWHKRWWQGGS